MVFELFMTRLEIGTTLGGRYRIERLLGEGGTGIVALAHDTETNRDVAMKAIRDELASTPSIAARFTREAKTAMSLPSEHVVRVNAVEHIEGVGPCVVMEYLRGSVLSQVIAAKGPLAISEAVRSMLEALEALETAHGLNLLHLDLRPANLFRVNEPDGSSSIKLLGGWTAAVPTQPTRPGMWGAPLYMAPERLKPPHSVDAHTDIWGVGIVLYELLTGAIPFNGETMGELFVQIMTKDPASLRALRDDIPEKLDAIVMRCLQRDPRLRYGDAHELATALAGLPEA